MRVSAPLVFILMLVFASCSEPEPPDHYFLDGYPELIFVDKDGNAVPTDFFIYNEIRNGAHFYVISDSSLVLINQKSREPYSGFIRTYHQSIYNIEGILRDGKIQRLRFWHPNRQLGMDADYVTGSGQAWTSSGQVLINWNKDEEYFLNVNTQKIKRINTDSGETYFDFDGNLQYFSVRTDTSYMQFYADSTPRFKFPITRDGVREGTVKRWHPNGQLQAIGEYRNGEEYGLWIQYDSLGNEIKREVY